jgi:hypothetical protein
MHENIIKPDNTIAQMPLAELRQKWSELWGIRPHARIGRQMLEKSLSFKIQGGLNQEQQKRLDHLMIRARVT